VRSRFLLLLTLVLASDARAAAEELAPLYARIAKEIGEGKPLVVTVHVALCHNGIIWCGDRGFGDGDSPRRNLYWGAAGLRAFFDHRAPGYRRVFLDRGDGRIVLERAVYRRRILPNGVWRRLGVKAEPFDLYLVALAYRGTEIGRASARFIEEVASERGESLQLPGGRTISYGGKGHVVGYAGHNHLMDAFDYSFPKLVRGKPLAYFALSCLNASYLARPLHSPQTRALLLTRSLMFPGAFTIEGLLSGLADAAPIATVYGRGVERYARFQKRPERAIRSAFIHEGEPRFARRYLRSR
jgi:hypothetical protein